MAERLDLLDPGPVLLDGLAIPRRELGLGDLIPRLREVLRIVRVGADHLGQPLGVEKAERHASPE